MSSDNQVVRKGDLVIKTYGSHRNYLREAGIYEKLNGSGLAPEVTFTGHDTLEHRFVEGETLYDRMLAEYESSDLLEEDLKRFFSWYAAFREKTGNSLEQLDLHKFILSADGLLYLDFEHCKASFMEGDLAEALAQLYAMKEPFSGRAHEVLCAFLRLERQYFDINGMRLAEAFSQALQKACSKAGVNYDAETAEKEKTFMV